MTLDLRVGLPTFCLFWHMNHQIYTETQQKKLNKSPQYAEAQMKRVQV